VPTSANQRGMKGVSSGQISQCVMKIHIDADATHPIGCARIRGPGNVATHARSTTAETRRHSRPARRKKSNANGMANALTSSRCRQDEVCAAAQPSRKHHTIVSGR
jgi:hypothetical protein